MTEIIALSFLCICIIVDFAINKKFSKTILYKALKEGFNVK